MRQEGIEAFAIARLCFGGLRGVIRRDGLRRRIGAGVPFLRIDFLDRGRDLDLVGLGHGGGGPAGDALSQLRKVARFRARGQDASAF